MNLWLIDRKIAGGLRRDPTLHDGCDEGLENRRCWWAQ